MILNDKHKILAVDDTQLEKIVVPEWDAEVYIRVLTGTDRVYFENAIDDKGKDRKNIMAVLCALSIVDDRGNRLFSNEDVDALSKKSSKALARIAKAALSLNLLTTGAVEAAKQDFFDDQNSNSTMPTH